MREARKGKEKTSFSLCFSPTSAKLEEGRGL
jgi:hypothetical protein